MQRSARRNKRGKMPRQQQRLRRALQKFSLLMMLVPQKKMLMPKRSRRRSVRLKRPANQSHKWYTKWRNSRSQSKPSKTALWKQIQLLVQTPLQLQSNNRSKSKRTPLPNTKRKLNRRLKSQNLRQLLRRLLQKMFRKRKYPLLMLNLKKLMDSKRS